jgi:hypothetical protein
MSYIFSNIPLDLSISYIICVIYFLNHSVGFQHFLHYLCYIFSQTFRWTSVFRILFILYIFSNVPLDFSISYIIYIIYFLKRFVRLQYFVYYLYYIFSQTFRWTSVFRTLFILYIFSNVSLNFSISYIIYIIYFLKRSVGFQYFVHYLYYIFSQTFRWTSVLHYLCYIFSQTFRWISVFRSLFILYIFSNIPLDFSISYIIYVIYFLKRSVGLQYFVRWVIFFLKRSGNSCVILVIYFLKCSVGLSTLFIRYLRYIASQIFRWTSAIRMLFCFSNILVYFGFIRTICVIWSIKEWVLLREFTIYSRLQIFVGRWCFSRYLRLPNIPSNSTHYSKYLFLQAFRGGTYILHFLPWRCEKYIITKHWHLPITVRL